MKGIRTAETGERRRRGKSDRRSQELSLVIRAALEQTVMVELLPRTQVDVYVQVCELRSAGIHPRSQRVKS